MAVTHTSMASPDETRTFPDTLIQIVNIGDVTVRRNTFQPGWRWSTNVGSASQEDRCHAHHVGYILSGTLRVASDDGSETDIRAGEAYEIQPGHDGWVVGDEPLMSIEFLGTVT